MQGKVSGNQLRKAREVLKGTKLVLMFHVGMRFHVGEKVERLLADSEEEAVLQEEGEGEELRQRLHDLLHVRLLRDLRHRVLGGRQSHHRQRRRQESEAE